MSAQFSTQINHTIDLLGQTVLLALAKRVAGRALDESEKDAIAEMQRVAKLLMEGTRFVQGLDQSARALDAGMAWQQMASFFPSVSPEDNRMVLNQFVDQLETLANNKLMTDSDMQALREILQLIIAAHRSQMFEAEDREHTLLLDSQH